MSTIQIRDIDENVKKAAEKVFKKMGISNSAGIKIYLNQVAVTGKIPFEPTTITENGFASQTEDQILSAWKDNSNDEEFDSADQLIAHLHESK